MEEKLGEDQGGFRRGRETTDQIFTLKETLLTRYKYNIPTHILFVDFSKAFITVNRSKLINTLYVLEIPLKLRNQIVMTLKDSVNIVKIKEGTGEPFKVQRGFRQGDSLSTTLFNLVLENIIKKQCTSIISGVFYEFRSVN